MQYGYGKNYRDELLKKLENKQSSGFDMQTIPDYQASYKMLTDYNDMVERPLFFKGRKPIEPKESSDDSESIIAEKLNYELTGIISVPNDLYCLLQEKNSRDRTNKFKKLREGDEIDGWSIKEIKPDHVIVGTDSESEKLKLAKPKMKKPKKPKPRSIKKPQNNNKNKKNSKQTPQHRRVNPNPFNQESRS